MSAACQSSPRRWSIRPRFWVCLVVLCAGVYAAASALPKLPRNPRADEVRDAALPVLAAITSYQNVHGGEAPSSLEQLVELLLGAAGTALPPDPWGRPLIYVPSSEQKSAFVCSYGADGRAGGVGEDSDVWLPVVDAGR